LQYTFFMMKIFFRRIHLYLSFAAGLVILICCLTGAILVFEKEAQMALNKDRYFVSATGTRQPVDNLIKSVKQAYPGAKVNSVKLYEAADRSAEINVVLPPAKTLQKGVPAVKKEDARPPAFTLFVNPYNGAVLEKYSYRETWFFQVFALHRWLLGGESSIGKLITGVATAIFLFILLTGIILWWPKTKNILLRRLKIKTTGSWKRINHDLHLVFGFYSAIFLFIFAFTGLAWSFEWFNKGIYQVTNSPLKPPPPPKSVYRVGEKINLEQALATAKQTYGNAVFYNLSLPKDSTDAIAVSALSKNAVHESATDAVYIDQFSGGVLQQVPFANRSLGAKVRSSFKPVHTGSIWGTPSKIIAFIVCLLGVTFPITGTIMWWNRTRKKNRSLKRKANRLEEIPA